MLKKILDKQFRANPAYRLVAYEQLSESERNGLQSLAEDADFYGLLLTESGTKAVDPETALLVFTLRNPGVVPSYVRHRLGQGANQALAELVLDDVLQIEVAGHFVSGAAASTAVYKTPPHATQNTHSLTTLSQNALRYAEQLPLMPVDQLSQRLYMYNMMPITPLWQRRLPSPKATAVWLGVDGWMDQYWRRIDAEDAPGWMSWQHRQVAPVELPYKLYISPRPELMAQLFKPFVEIMAAQRVPNFKIGKGVLGLLRADKMVAYLPDFEHLAAVAQALQAAIGACDAQGVPFTAPIDTAGVLSWGMDPPDSAHVFAGDTRESWRFWIVERLAGALLAAKESTAMVRPWQFALDRLQLEGIDTQRWIPKQTLWRS